MLNVFQKCEQNSTGILIRESFDDKGIQGRANTMHSYLPTCLSYRATVAKMTSLNYCSCSFEVSSHGVMRLDGQY